MRVGEREILVVVCLLLLTGSHHSVVLHNGGTDIALYPGGGGGGITKGWGVAAHYVHGVLINWKLAKSPVRDALKVPCTVWKMMMNMAPQTDLSIL